MRNKNSYGFTLIELLTVIAIIGILSYISIAGFHLFRANAAYASVERSLVDARTGVEIAVSNPDNLPPSVGLLTQNTQGTLTDASARNFLPAFQVSRDVSFSMSYDAACDNALCQSAFIQARHRYGKEYAQWIRFGDGLAFTVEHVAGAGW